MVKIEIKGWMSVGITPMHSFSTVYPKLCSPNGNPLKKIIWSCFEKIGDFGWCKGQT
jgi:hypothetical protein